VIDFEKVLKITGCELLDLIVVEPQHVQGQPHVPDLRLLRALQHPRYPVVTELEDLHAFQRGQLGVRYMRQLVVVEVEMGQMGHPVPEDGRIDLGQAVLS